MTLDLAKVRADVKIRGMDLGLFRGVWPLEGWDYRRKVTITEQSGNDLTDYQVLVELNSTNFNFAHAQTNGEDIRFADEEGNLRDYWIEKWDAANEEAKVWVKVPSIPANGITELYMYYGNPSASSESDASATFIRVIDGVVGSWHFDEGSGTTAYDSSGNDNDGSLTNMDPATAWVDGKFDKALEFDGIDDYVDCGNDPSLDLPGPLSIEAWIKWTIDPSDTSDPWPTIVNRNDDYGYRLAHTQNADYFEFGVIEGSEGRVQSLTSPTQGVWYHLVGTYDLSKLRIYVNGEFENDADRTGTISSNNAHVIIGDRSSLDRSFTGVIDEVRIYNRALTAEEISDLYNNYGYTTENYPGKVLVRKYADPEPSVSVGGEETP